jgi:hypothetical protein
MAKTDNKPLNSANSLTGLLADFRLLIILFVALRLLLLMAYQPLTIQGIERGVSAGGDFAHYFGLGELTNRGLMPFRDWWSEFPPVPSFLITFVFRSQAGRITLLSPPFSACSCCWLMSAFWS